MTKRKSVIPSVSRVYANVNHDKGSVYHEYQNLMVKWSSPDRYSIIRKLGRGKYSEVFEGMNEENKELIIIKVLKPIRFRKIKREIKILENLKNGVNIISLLDCVRDEDSKVQSFIFECIHGVELKTACLTFTDIEVRYYLLQLLRALDFCHSMGIIHRDVKPRNIMVNTKEKKLRLIDWGLAEFYFPGVEYNVRVATRHYKGPELLVDYRYYDYSLDIWSAGCVLAGMIFMKDPFFRGTSNINQLVKIAKVLGTKGLSDYVNKYNAYNVPEVRNIISRHVEKRSWNDFVNKQNKHLVTDDALLLLDKLLIYDHQLRPTAAEAMKDPYFDPVRDFVGKEGVTV